MTRARKLRVLVDINIVVLDQCCSAKDIRRVSGFVYEFDEMRLGKDDNPSKQHY